MTGSPFRAFAERHDLDYAEAVEEGGIVPKGVGEVVGGRLPGDFDGIIASHVQPVEGTSAREPGVVAVTGRNIDTYYMRHSSLVLTRIPESAAFLPYVTCRDTAFHGAMDRWLGPGGLIPLIDHIEFESIALNRRYRIGIFRGFGENRLRQLFAPTVIDWMAHEAPDGIYFELMGGMLQTTIGGIVETEQELEHACLLAGRLVEIIRSESLEGVGESGTPQFQVSPKQEEYERTMAQKLAAVKFEAPPTDVATAAKAIEPVVKAESRGFLRKVFSSINESEALLLAVEAVARGYAERHDLAFERGTDFIARHLALPVPVAPKHSMRGTIPGTKLTGDLFVHAGGTEATAGAAIPWPTGDTVLQVLPPGRDEAETTPIGSYQLVVGEGARRESEPTQAGREAAAAIAQELGGRYGVSGRHIGPETLTRAMREWLGGDAEGKRGVVLGGETLLMFGRTIPLEEFSAAELDRVTASVAAIAS